MLDDRFTCVRGRVQVPTESGGRYVRARHDVRLVREEQFAGLRGTLLQSLAARMMESSFMLSTGDAAVAFTNVGGQCRVLLSMTYDIRIEAYHAPLSRVFFFFLSQWPR